jgi:hypothetical protein
MGHLRIALVRPVRNSVVLDQPGLHLDKGDMQGCGETAALCFIGKSEASSAVAWTRRVGVGGSR